MSAYETYTETRRFTRNADRAIVAGVCAGIADYFGFNLRCTRVLAFISLLVAFPFTLLLYFGAVLLFPASHDSGATAGLAPTPTSPLLAPNA